MKITGQPLSEGFSPDNAPHTISYAIMYRARIDSFYELPKDKRPPKNLWDKPFKLSEYFDDIFKHTGSGDEKDFVEFDDADIE